ncbi:molybdenum cofactor guanylyltransferase [Agromyces salentinus]|uniref:MobA-like NTP transferase domain-containing protein n=1 Tax=Agromyces salentinus TaxID=269421 RepID=A0ABN2MJU7_9MICO|nr:NTP transferase domain-containing protein [Agromyces salentinus]
MTDAATRQLDAVLLAGGRASRLGGVSKPGLTVGDRTLLQHAVDAAHAAGAERIVVVGPPSLEAPGCLVVLEDPPFGGPVAAIAAGLAALDADASRRSRGDASRDPGARPATSDVLVLACDLPTAADAVARLTARRREPGESGRGGEGEHGDGVHLVDADGRSQWLTGIYARGALDRAFDAIGTPDGSAMRHLVASLDLLVVDDDGTAADIDTWHDLDLARARSRARARSPHRPPGPRPDPTTAEQHTTHEESP